MRPLRRRPRTVITAGVAAVAVLTAAGWLTHWRSAESGSATSPSLAWTAAQAPLPANAAGGSGQNAVLDGVACPAAGSCVAVGAYTAAGREKSLIETLSGGTWVASSDMAGAGVSQLTGVACPAQGSCVAVGASFTGQDANPVVATLSDGTWTATGLPLPGDADRSKPTFLDDVACPAQGTCIATGEYVDQNGDSRALIDTLSGGSWTAMRAPLPAGAVPTLPATTLGAPRETSLDDAVCPAGGSCVAVGQYTERGGAAVAFVDTLSGGTWTPVTVPLPGNAVADGQAAGLWGISCRTSGNCVAVGNYTSRDGQARYLAETLSGGTWTPATPPMPADAAASQNPNQEAASLEAVACQVVGSCVALGYYGADGGAFGSVIDTLSGATWTAATAPRPPRAVAAEFNRAVCPASGNCVAVGSYPQDPQDSSNQALIETATGKTG